MPDDPPSQNRVSLSHSVASALHAGKVSQHIVTSPSSHARRQASNARESSEIRQLIPPMIGVPEWDPRPLKPDSNVSHRSYAFTTNPSVIHIHLDAFLHGYSARNRHIYSLTAQQLGIPTLIKIPLLM
ncbi:hypothetical protein HGRIS_006991 [Hohenbuehelia grisea]|uniref:Uncharacterized protein n=1 Tax=Hohenbuehelia grisea TaxID=104357 RepID=A0ABR3JBF1_9AGAR